jgi:hypothetical protein
MIKIVLLIVFAAIILAATGSPEKSDTTKSNVRPMTQYCIDQIHEQQNKIIKKLDSVDIKLENILKGKNHANIHHHPSH